jgi:hypothetical protein
MRFFSKKSLQQKIIFYRKWFVGFSVIVIFLIAVIVFFLLKPADRQINWPTIIGGFLIGVAGSLIASLIFILIYSEREKRVEDVLDLGLIDAWNNRRGSAPPEEQPIHWLKIVTSARNSCILMGTSLSGYCTVGHDWIEFQKFVREKISKVNFDILFLDPRKPVANLRAKEEMTVKNKNTYNRIYIGITEFWKLKQSLDIRNKEKFKMYVYQSIPTFSVTFADNYMIVTHYLPNAANEDCPAYGLIDFKRLREGEGLYHVYEANLKALKEPGNEITGANFAEIIKAAQDGEEMINKEFRE